MTSSIWKYPLTPGKSQTVSMPSGATPLSVGVAQGEMCLWAAVTTEAPRVQRTINVLGTGWDWQGHPPGKFIGTVVFGKTLLGDCVWHVFDAGPY